MPTSIPYDPSLTLGSVVHPATLARLLEIAQLQAPIDAAQEELNSLIAMKRSVDGTLDELINLKIDTGGMVKKTKEINSSVSKAATAYALTRIQQESKIQPLRAKISAVTESIESPIDYNTTVITQFPLASDSLKMDAQYFAFDENDQHANNTLSALKEFIEVSGEVAGDTGSISLAKSAVKQVAKQRETHKIIGTLVVTASCTHKNASVLAPFMLDVDKAVQVWNQMFTADEDKLRPDDVGAMSRALDQQGTAKEKSFNIISGATFGSSFVGMVHTLRNDSTTSDQVLESKEKSIKAYIKWAGVLSKGNGGFGMDKSMADDIKELLSTSNVTSHVSILTMGFIPSLKSGLTKTIVKGFVDFDGDKMMKKLAILESASRARVDSANADALAAQTGGKMVALAAGAIASAASALATIDAVANKTLDINSMMTAFDDYVTRVALGAIGVPIDYYLKPITRTQIVHMWMTKYYPGRFLEISGDDRGKKTRPPSASNDAPADAPADAPEDPPADAPEDPPADDANN